MSKNQLSILVVEDNPINQLYLKTLLVRKGYTVRIAEDGAEAIKQFADSIEEGDRFDLIFMDLQMPGTDGFEAASRIRALEEQSKNTVMKTPISALSAYPLREETERPELECFDHYLTKPVTKQQIEEALVQLIFSATEKPEPLAAPNGSAATDSTAASQNEPDETRVEQYSQTLLKEFGQDREDLRQMLQLALEDIPQKVSELDFYFKSRDQQQSCAAAHALANVVGVLCAPAEREVALNLEKLFRAGDWDAARQAYLQLQERVQLLLQAYRLLLNRELSR